MALNGEPGEFSDTGAGRTEAQNDEETRFMEAAEAADLLYEMSLSGENDEQEITRLRSKIGPGAVFIDRLINTETVSAEEGFPKEISRASSHFFETLPIVNRLANLKHNYNDRRLENGLPRLFNSDIDEVSSNANYILYTAWQGVDGDTVNRLDENNAGDFLGSVRLMLESNEGYIMERASDFLDKYENQLLQLSAEKSLPSIASKITEMRVYMSSQEFERSVIGATHTEIVRGKDKKLQILRCRSLLEEIFAKRGIILNDALEILDSQSEAGSQLISLERNLNLILDLEDERPGIVHFLRQKFGIRNFERYPKNILMAQFDEYENADRPYGVLIHAVDDWNRAFNRAPFANIWGRLFEQLGEQYNLRIVEVGNKTELARRLIELDRKYGAHHKIAFAFIAGHGNVDSVLLGGSRNREHLLKKDFSGRGVRRVRDFFVNHPVIVLDSCLTGSPGGISEELSRVYGAKVIAPSNETFGMKNLGVVINGDEIDFEVEYEFRAKSGTENIYDAGALIST